MNILPKKRWHVRNRENIARVRKDEALAAEQEKEKERRIQLAEQEAKIQFMRTRTKNKFNFSEVAKCENVQKVEEGFFQEHVNFFKNLEEGNVVSNAKNLEREREIKEEKEKYEKQIGYLTYLGQDTNEATGKVSWYNQPRSTLISSDNEEKDVKNKNKYDPAIKYKQFFFKNLPTKNSSTVSDTIENKRSKLKKLKCKLKHKKKKKYSSGSSNSNSNTSSDDEKLKKEKLRLLREKRLKREHEEKLRAEKLLAKLNGTEEVTNKEPEEQFHQKYNSQFNPHLAKQNKLI